MIHFIFSFILGVLMIGAFYGGTKLILIKWGRSLPAIIFGGLYLAGIGLVLLVFATVIFSVFQAGLHPVDNRPRTASGYVEEGPAAPDPFHR